MQTRQNEAGFTLIGMLIAVGIVALNVLVMLGLWWQSSR